MKFDLHLHTTASDGSLSPAELLVRGRRCGLDVMAITDHDTVAGVRQAQQFIQANPDMPTLVTGVEFSCHWGKLPIHVVGLNMQIDNAAFAKFVVNQQQLRAQRNDAILDRLEKVGINGIRGALNVEEADSLAQLGRPQIADALVNLGSVKSRQRAFKRYLGVGKSASVSVSWPSLADTVAIINSAGGDAILAHPLHYRLTGSKLNALLRALMDCGAAGFELFGSGQSAEQRRQLTRLALKFEVRCSVGSDFHSDDAPWQALGMLPELPDNCVPVWQDWGLDK